MTLETLETLMTLKTLQTTYIKQEKDMNEPFRLEQATTTLDAIVSAMEGEVQLGYHGFQKAFNNNDYELFLVLDNGQTITPDQANLCDLEAAINRWRDEHMQFFQKILGAMM